MPCIPEGVPYEPAANHLCVALLLPLICHHLQHAAEAVHSCFAVSGDARQWPDDGSDAGRFIRVLAVFDGHGGQQASELAVKRLGPLLLRRLQLMKPWTEVAELKAGVAEALRASLLDIDEEFAQVH